MSRGNLPLEEMKMRVLSVSEFLEWHRAKPPEVYILSSDNQDRPHAPCARASLRFENVSGAPELQYICFFGCGGSLSVHCVKEVHMFDDVRRVGTVFEIICNSGEDVYRFLADEA